MLTLTPFSRPLVLAALITMSIAAFANTPNPTTVTIVGNFQSQVGRAANWCAECSSTRLTYYESDDVWAGTFIVPAGLWEYKVALNGSFDENYGVNATRDGASVTLWLMDDAYVTFYYDHKTHWVTDDWNSLIITVPGDYVSGLGGWDWAPNCMRSWLEDPDGDGIYTFSTDQIQPGVYETRVAYNLNWGLNYGVGGELYGPNYIFSVSSAGAQVVFCYDPMSYLLTISSGDEPNLPPTAVAGDDQQIRAGQTVYLDGMGSSDDATASESLLYAWSFVSVPSGSAGSLLDADSAFASFLADKAGVYVVSLVVTDEAGLASAADEVVIDASNLAPVAMAKADPVAAIVGNTVYLDGSGSADPEGGALVYTWRLTSAPAGSGATLSGADAAEASFVPDVAGAYVVSLEVSDEFGPGAPAAVTVTATTASALAKSKAIDAKGKVAALTTSQVSTKGNKTALENFLNQAVAALTAGDLNGAIDKLQKSIERTDGCALRGAPDVRGAGQDWVTDCSAQAVLYGLLVDALNALVN